MISFDGIPTTIRVPFVYIEFDNSGANRGASLMPYRNLIIGQKRSTGTQPELTPIRVTSKEEAQGYFGLGSMLAHMVERQLQNNPYTETWAVAIDDVVGGVAASCNLTVGGVVAAGAIPLYIAGRRLSIGVAADDELADIATNIAAAITASTNLPVTAAVDGEVDEKVVITYRHKGLVGNGIDVRTCYYDDESLPTGLTVTISAMANGATNPDLDEVWAVLGDEHYNVITNPYTDAANMTSLKAELVERWGPMRMIESLAFSAAKGTHGDLGTLGDTHNSPHVSIMSAAYSPSPTYEWAAAVAGQTSFNGNIDPARPFKTIVLKGILPAKRTERFTQTQNNLLLFDGISTSFVDNDGSVRIQRLITTYKTNPQGAEDPSYLEVNTPLTLGYIRYDFRTYILNKYPRHKLADDGTRFGQGQVVMTPKVGKAEAIARFRLWESMGLVEGIDQFKEDLICERNVADRNRMDWFMAPDLVNQFMIGGVKIGFLL